MVFSNTTTEGGIAEVTRRLVNANTTNYPIKELTANTNNALDIAMGHYLLVDTRWEFDDTNHTDLPIGTTDLVANQEDYSFAQDENGYDILRITRVSVMDANGDFQLLKSIDQSEVGVAMSEYKKTAGQPAEVDILANSFFLKPKPSYSQTAGIKVHFIRQLDYFVSTDTTKEAGIPSPYHMYFVYHNAVEWLLAHGTDRQMRKLPIFEKRRDEVLAAFISHLETRGKRVRKVLTPKVRNRQR